MCTNELKSTKAITLIALVITIVVLLILAGISLNLIMGDGGILNRATNARKTSDLAGAQEQVELLASEYAYDYLQEKYVNGNTGVAANTGAHVASQLSIYASSHTTMEGCTFSVSETTVTLSKDGATVTGTVQESGSITWGSLANGGSGNGGDQQGGDEPAVEYDGLTQAEEDLLEANNMAELTVEQIEANVDATSGLDATEKAARKAALEDTSKIKTVLTGNTPVPVGYTYALGTSTDANSAGTNGWGVVIKDSADNEFVWVPVPDAKVLYDEIEGEGTEVGKSEEIQVASLGDMPSIQLAETGVKTTKKSKSEIISGFTRDSIEGEGYREPALVTYYGLDSDYYSQAGFASAEAMATAFVTDYNNMIDSIAKYGGFYVGRYELSLRDGSGNEGSEALNHEFATGTTAHIKSGRAPADGFNWYQLYKACRSLGNSTVASTMIWGCQWDILCQWGQAKGDKVSYSEYDSNRHTGSEGYSEATGSNSNDKRNNIFDLEGSRYEWTQEACYTNYRVYRGGNFYNSDYAGYYGYYGGPYGDNDYGLGSRATLYIK